jgi:DNA invertase Pin-like site-specific DNA recombinase
VQAGKIDIIVVYKADRLTRSLECSTHAAAS